MSTAAVVLAAGGGSRFAGDGHKLVADLHGTSVAGRAVRSALGAELDEVAVVVGSRPDLELPPGVTVLVNDRWRDGQGSSLRRALDWAGGRDLDAVVVGLGDQPGLDPEAWRRVAAATATPVAVATYAGRRGHPVRLGRATWELIDDRGDRGARDLLAGHPGWVTEVACPGDPGDIDTVEDLETWRRR